MIITSPLFMVSPLLVGIWSGLLGGLLNEVVGMEVVMLDRGV